MIFKISDRLIWKLWKLVAGQGTGMTSYESYWTVKKEEYGVHDVWAGDEKLGVM